MKRFIIGGLAALAIVGAAPTAPVQADDNVSGCQTVLWGFLGSQRRTVCDGYIEADGGWWRQRTIWSPERYIPVRCGYYSCWGGYWQEATGSRELYKVYPNTVLPDEPGHLS